MRFVSIFLCAGIVMGQSRPNKRLQESGDRAQARGADSIPVIGGGVDIDPELVRENPNAGLTIVPDSGDVLLETAGTIPEEFFFFTDMDFGLGNAPRENNRGRKTLYCSAFFKNDGQGDCNSCWAYSVTRVMSLKACLSNYRTSGDSTNYDLDPMSMICKLAAASRNARALAGEGAKKIDLSEDGCQARPIQDVLEYLQGHALPRSSSGATGRVVERLSTGDLGRTEDSCDNLATEVVHTPMGLTMFGTRSRALRGRASMQREIMANGPIVIIMRLTQEFVDFTGSLFNPTTFSYLDREGRKLPEGTRLDEDDWNNHFMVAVGWAVSPDGVPAWIVLNSWGPIYDLGEYTKHVVPIQERGKQAKSTSATMIAMAVDGSRKMEISNRYSYSIATPKMTDLRQSYYQVVPSSVEPLSAERESEMQAIGPQRNWQGKVVWDLPQPPAADKIAVAITEREEFIRLVIAGTSPTLGTETREYVKKLCLAFKEFGCPSYAQTDSPVFFDAMKWLNRRKEIILEEEKEKKGKTGLVLTDYEKRQIQTDKENFLNEVRQGKKPDLVGNKKFPLVKRLCIGFYPEGCPRYPNFGADLQAYWKARKWLEEKIASLQRK